MPSQSNTEQLVRLARTGNEAAINRLLDRHRDRLKRMVAVRMDDRLKTRFDPSDVVQDTLVSASQKLSGYLDQRPLPLYPWLRQQAWECLVDLHRKHLSAEVRSVDREASWPVSNESAAALARQMVDSGNSPSRHATRRERAERVRQALDQVCQDDRELLLMRHLEQLKVPEIAAVLKLTEPAVKSRLRRALERMHRILGDEWGESAG